MSFQKLLFLLLLTVGSTPYPLWANEVVTADNKTVAFDRVEIESSGAVPRAVLYQGTQAVATISCDEIVEMAFRPVKEIKEYSEKHLWAVFTSGDRVLGTLQEKTVEGGFQVRTLCGPLDLKTDMLSAILVPLNRKALPVEAPKTGQGDVMITRTGDQIEGAIQSITADEIRFNATKLQTNVTKKLADVAAVYLMTLDKPPQEPDTVLAMVTLVDGSSIRGRLQASKAETLRLTGLYGQDWSIPMSDIAAVYFKNGKVVYLSDLTPVRVEEQPNYIRDDKPHPGDLIFPYQKDLSVRETKLVLKGVQYRKGLGVHSRSALTFRVDKKFSTFAVTAGLDDAALSCPKAMGSVVFEIWADGKKVHDSGPVQTADAPREISIPLRDVAELTLVVDYGANGSVCDYADWAGARLIR